MVVPLLAAGVLTMGGGSAWRFSNGHADPAAPGQAHSMDICQQQFERQFTDGISPRGGPKAGFAPLNCNDFFGQGGQPTE
jgi:hypothetical protein